MVVMFGSLVLGQSVATEDYGVVSVIVGGVILVGVIITLKYNIWILLPMLFAFNGRILLLPLPFSVSNLTVMFVFTVVVSQVALGFIDARLRVTKTDFLGFLCLGGIGLTFLLNPVGIAAMGSDTVGSRPYFEILLSVLAYLVLAVVTPDLATLRKLPIYVISLSFIMAMGQAVAYFFISVGMKLQMVYSGFAPQLEYSADPNAVHVSRLRFVVGPFKRWMLYAMARPNAWRNMGLVITILIIIAHLVGALMTGHRLALINWAAHIGLFIFITRKFQIGLILGAAGLCMVGGLYTYHHTIGPIPLSAQRVLTTLPGDWDHNVVKDTNDSTEWRIEMWEQAIFDEEMIRNKFLGDGFGYSSRELLLIGEMATGEGMMGGVRPEDLAQYYLLTGDLHSGPVSTIKHVGYLGLCCVVLFIISIAVGYYKLCRRNQGKPLWIVFMFFGIPAVWKPISFVFLYGDFKTDFGAILVTAGLLKILQKAEILQNRQLLEQQKASSA